MPWPFRRAPAGKHALGAAVTGIPSGPVRSTEVRPAEVVAPAPVARPVPVGPEPLTAVVPVQVSVAPSVPVPPAAVVPVTTSVAPVGPPAPEPVVLDAHLVDPLTAPLDVVVTGAPAAGPPVQPPTPAAVVPPQPTAGGRWTVPVVDAPVVNAPVVNAPVVDAPVVDVPVVDAPPAPPGPPRQAGAALSGVAGELLALAAELDAAAAAPPLHRVPQQPAAPGLAPAPVASPHQGWAALPPAAAPHQGWAVPPPVAAPHQGWAVPPPVAAPPPAGPRVELGFADGTYRMLDPASPAARALSDLVGELTRGGSAPAGRGSDAP